MILSWYSGNQEKCDMLVEVLSKVDLEDCVVVSLERGKEQNP